MFDVFSQKNRILLRELIKQTLNYATKDQRLDIFGRF